MAINKLIIMKLSNMNRLNNIKALLQGWGGVALVMLFMLYIITLLVIMLNLDAKESIKLVAEIIVGAGLVYFAWQQHRANYINRRQVRSENATEVYKLIVKISDLSKNSDAKSSLKIIDLVNEAYAISQMKLTRTIKDDGEITERIKKLQPAAESLHYIQSKVGLPKVGSEAYEKDIATKKEVKATLQDIDILKLRLRQYIRGELNNE